VDSVSWNGIQAFISQLGTSTGMSFRLPTEAEWEYAARSGGLIEKYAGTSDDATVENYAWIMTNSGSQTHPVGLKLPNGLGLYDMSGNIREWVQDWYGYYGTEPQTDPTGPVTGAGRVMRGGNAETSAFYVRTTTRWEYAPETVSLIFGFRLVLEL
jgi:formylglycine-generating enzyme required for sulfatase activity